MDTLSVLSTVLKKTKKDHPINTKKKINNWLKILDKKFYIKAKVINFDKLKDWSVNLKNITQTLESTNFLLRKNYLHTVNKFT